MRAVWGVVLGVLLCATRATGGELVHWEVQSPHWACDSVSHWVDFPATASVVSTIEIWFVSDYRFSAELGGNVYALRNGVWSVVGHASYDQYAPPNGLVRHVVHYYPNVLTLHVGDRVGLWAVCYSNYLPAAGEPYLGFLMDAGFYGTPAQ